MTSMSYYDTLPDPDRHEDIYADTPGKRLLAWIVDMVAIALLCALVLPFTAFTGIFFFPFLMMVVGFAYRTVTLARGSATWGMRLMGMEIRTLQGQRLDLGTAFLHTLGYNVSLAVFPLQVISIVLMLTSARRQGLTDHIIGTAPVNRMAVY
ncbi:MAG: RDD family protein [Pseudomonadota bacterium]|nr:RDD family protein [Pseudomonadota bacterium]MEE3072277.1 RDD family protein [Pseudomonadota bacterium]